MCGRYVSLSSPDRLAERFHVDEVRTPPLPARYNVAPSTEIYAVLEVGDSRRLGTLRWGFLPWWAPSASGGTQPINARLESIAGSRMFGASVERRRCLLPADGFYEWQARGAGARKQPFHISDPEGGVLAFAGLWSSWRDPHDEDAEPLFTTAIVTTEASADLEPIHSRMPLILPESVWAEWLDPRRSETTELLGMVRSLPAPHLVTTAISTRVNAVRNEGPELLLPGTVDDPADTTTS